MHSNMSSKKRSKNRHAILMQKVVAKCSGPRHSAFLAAGLKGLKEMEKQAGRLKR